VQLSTVVPAMRQAYQTGRGSVMIRAVAEIQETAKGRHQIVVTEVPYSVNKATLIERIAELHKEKKITITISVTKVPAASVRIVSSSRKMPIQRRC
jgi:DNA gyrase/topoisomerase IV subunit A